MQKCQAGDSTCYPAAKEGTWLNTPSPPPVQTHPSSRETWAILHRADEVLNLHVTQAELQNTAACPSYQMTWNSARSSAVTAGSPTKREKLLPGCWTRASARSPGTRHARPPTLRCCSHPPAWHGLKTSCVLRVLHADSFLYVFIFHLHH